MRTCVIHIGTHKTGTTSVQLVLSAIEAQLTANGYSYPRAGRPSAIPYAHHNIAWELSSDRRFDQAEGTVEDLLAEVRSGSHHVLLSSEDFECAIVRNADRFCAFVRRLQACSLSVRIVVYFRNQIDYLQSLYLTMLGLGLETPFDEYLQEVLDTGQFRWQDWAFPFVYDDLLGRLKPIDGLDLVVRSYERAQGGSVVDFLSLLGLDPGGLAVDVNSRANVRPNIGNALRRFCANQRRRPLDRLEEQAIDSTVEFLKDARLDISGRSRQRIVDNFQTSPVSGLEWAVVDLEAAARGNGKPGDHTHTLLMEGLFSSEFIAHLDRAVALFRGEAEALIRERDELAVQHRNLIADRDALLRERGAILQSRSWKLTAPLRGILGLLRRMRPVR